MRDQRLLKSIVIYSDGACSGNPGPGGWATIVVWPEGRVRELGGPQNPTTNNQMELMGVIRGLEAVVDRDEAITVFTDSTYVIRGITQWIWGWRRKGWMNAEGQEVSNRELWERLSRVVTRIEKDREKGHLQWQYIRGHTGNPGNERCDEISVRMSKGQWVDLYDGSVLNYPVAVHDFPEEVPLPEMKPKQEKKAAYSYLSFLDGRAVRHRDWASCERRVKGRSGAKFKKAESAADEATILSGWGVNPARLTEEE